MLLGPGRFDLAGEEFLRMIQEELAASGHPSRPADVAALLGLGPEELWTWLDRQQRAALDELIRRWNTHADGHSMARVVLVDHGEEAELFLGHPLRPGHPKGGA